MKHCCRFLFLIVFGLAANCHAATVCQREYKVVVAEAEPLYVRDSQGQTWGFIYDIIQELRKRTGCHWDVKTMNRRHILGELAGGRADIFMFSAKNDVMDKGAKFIPLMRIHRELLMNKETAKGHNQVADLFADKKITFIRVADVTPLMRPAEVRMLEKGGRIMTVSDYNKAFSLLGTGRGYVLVQTVLTNEYFLKKMKITDQYKQLLDNIHTFETGAYCNPQKLNSKEQEFVRNMLLEIRRDGTLADILSKYISYPRAEEIREQWSRP